MISSSVVGMSGSWVVRVIQGSCVWFRDRVCGSDTAGVLIPPYVYFDGP